MTKVHIIYTLLYSYKNFIPVQLSHDTAPLSVCSVDAREWSTLLVYTEILTAKARCAKTGKQPFFILSIFAVMFPFQ